MGTPTTKTELLKTLESELTKTFQLVDAYGRPSKIYTAPVFAKTGDPCFVSEITYLDTISSTITGKKEGYTTWDETFIPDTDFTVSTTLLVSKTEVILTNENELTKQYQALDGRGRPVRIYEASVIASTGSPCKVTEYTYQNATSTVFKGKKEAYALWDSTWIPDSLFTVTF